MFFENLSWVISFSNYFLFAQILVLVNLEVSFYHSVTVLYIIFLKHVFYLKCLNFLIVFLQKILLPLCSEKIAFGEIIFMSAWSKYYEWKSIIQWDLAVELKTVYKKSHVQCKMRHIIINFGMEEMWVWSDCWSCRSVAYLNLGRVHSGTLATGING